MSRGTGTRMGSAGIMKVGGQLFKSSMGISNPCPMLFKVVALVGLIQGLEHIDVPLAELMHPFRDQMHAVCVLNHVVKTTLKGMSQYQKNKEIIKRKTYHKGTLAIKYDDDQWSIQEAIRQKHEEEHHEKSQPDEFQEVHSGSTRVIGRIRVLAFRHENQRLVHQAIKSEKAVKGVG